MKKLFSAGFAVVVGVLMCTSFAAAAEKFVALSGIPAEQLTEQEMAKVEGTGFFRLRSIQFSTSNFSFIKITINDATQTAYGPGFQTLSWSGGGITVTASSHIQYMNTTITP